MPRRLFPRINFSVQPPTNSEDTAVVSQGRLPAAAQSGGRPWHRLFGDVSVEMQDTRVTVSLMFLPIFKGRQSTAE